MKNMLIFLLLQGVYNDTLTFDVMIMLTFPQLNFIIVIMCVVGFYLEYYLASFFMSNKD